MASINPSSRRSRFRLGRKLAPLAVLLTQACAQPPAIATVEQLDLERFMGRWYVIASIPTFMERDAHNADETYRREVDGTIATTFAFRRGGFHGKRVEYRPRGFVSADSPAVWGMQFVWPVKAEYRIAYLAPDYSQTIVGRTKRDYVWLMARTPTISPADYDRHVERIRALGYDVGKLAPVPQQW
jgi:apolipoprotein D and lipocalin family protein